MLQHTVYFYLDSEVTSEERDQFEKGLEDLLQIPEIHKAEMGPPADTPKRDVNDHSFTFAIYTWFETMEDYEVYADHPDHLKFLDTYSPIFKEVKVYDIEISYAVW